MTLQLSVFVLQGLGVLRQACKHTTDLDHPPVSDQTVSVATSRLKIETEKMHFVSVSSEARVMTSWSVIEECFRYNLILQLTDTCMTTLTHKRDQTLRHMPCSLYSITQPWDVTSIAAVWILSSLCWTGVHEDIYLACKNLFNELSQNSSVDGSKASKHSKGFVPNQLSITISSSALCK